MAVYGKNRKKIRLSSETPIFSSDEEPDSSDHTGVISTTEKLFGIINDSSTTTSTRSQDLLPSLDIQSSRSSPKKTELATLEDQLTASPRKYKRVVRELESSPTKPRSLGKELSKAAGSGRNDVKSSVPGTPKKSRESTSVNSTPRSNKTPRISPGTPQEKDAWADLFSNIDEVKSVPKPAAIVEDEDEYEPGSSQGHINNLASIYKEFDSPSRINGGSPLIHDSPSKEFRGSPRKTKIQPTRLTYGQDRSFLLKDDQEDNTSPVDRRVPDSPETEIIEDVANIHDLRTLGKINQRKDTTEYLLEGLQFKSTGNLASSNSILITTLLDLTFEMQSSDVDHIMEIGSVIAKRLVDILTKQQKTQSIGKSPIEWLISVCFYQILNRSSEPAKLSVHGSDQLHSMLDTLGIVDIPVENLSAISRKRISELKGKLGTPREIQLSYISILKHNSKLGWELFDSVGELYLEGEDNNEVLSFIENYMENSNYIESLGVLTSLIPQTLRSLSHNSPLDLQIMKIVVLLSTNYNSNREVTELIYSNRYVCPLIEIVNTTLGANNLAKLSALEANTTLFILAYLNNFAENKAIHIESSKEVDVLFTLVLSVEPTDTHISHMVAYGSLFVGYMYKFKQLEVNEKSLIEKLVSLKSIGLEIRERIEKLVKEIE